LKSAVAKPAVSSTNKKATISVDRLNKIKASAGSVVKNTQKSDAGFLSSVKKRSSSATTSKKGLGMSMNTSGAAKKSSGLLGGSSKPSSTSATKKSTGLFGGSSKSSSSATKKSSGLLGGSKSSSATKRGGLMGGKMGKRR
jgi:hypothetical protein